MTSIGTTTAGPHCSGCGAQRSLQDAEADPRPPCLGCAATALSWSVGATDKVYASDSVAATLTPADQDRGWKRRWSDTKREAAAIAAPRMTGMSAEATHEAAQALMSYFGLAYHLKDALKAASPMGLQPSIVEQAISNDPILALLADLANLDKHFVLTQAPRSGDVPRPDVLRSTTLPGGGWRLNMPIRHKEAVVDGIGFAETVVDAGARHLRLWGLIP